jgi:HlyD family secretion protein
LAKLISKQTLKWILPIAAVLIAGFFVFRYVQGRKEALPQGIISGNGRIEATLVDVSAREPLRVRKINVDEGDIVRRGQVLVELDTDELEAELAEAKAAVAAAEERSAYAKASIVKQKSEISLANVEAKRAKNLVRQGAGSQRDYDVRKSKVETTKASLSEAEAMLEAANQKIEEAKAKVKWVQTRIDDATLESPINGRVLYKLAEEGEVLGAGGKALTVVNLEDVYMEIFVPSDQAASVRINSEARITVDFDPTRAIPAKVSFVSPEAQFTPKQVETKSEREKLMFRVKLRVPTQLGSQYIERIKTGVRGVGYIRTQEHVEWPERLQKLVPSTPPEARR